jgi:hypothetical protein
LTEHNHPTSPDYMLLDEAVRELDGRLGADLLPIDVAVTDLDVNAVAFVAKFGHTRSLRQP